MRRICTCTLRSAFPTPCRRKCCRNAWSRSTEDNWQRGNRGAEEDRRRRHRKSRHSGEIRTERILIEITLCSQFSRRTCTNYTINSNCVIYCTYSTLHSCLDCCYLLELCHTLFVTVSNYLLVSLSPRAPDLQQARVRLHLDGALRTPEVGRRRRLHQVRVHHSRQQGPRPSTEVNFGLDPRTLLSAGLDSGQRRRARTF